MGSEHRALRHPRRDLGHALHLAAGAGPRHGLRRRGGHLPERGLPGPGGVRGCCAASNCTSIRCWGQLPEQLEHLLKNLIELLAAIPSVVYGLWGLFVVIPLIRPVCNWLHLKLGWIPFFGTDLSGPGVLPAVIVLSIMILPTITAISRDALVSVPPKLRMAAYGLGATRWETILAVILPTAARGIFGGVVLAFGRALGETMALAMLVGNANQISAFAVLAGEHAGGAAGQQLSGSRAPRRSAC